jgi:hypothetical protein
MRPRTRLLEKITNGRVRDWDFLKIKSEARPGRDRESHAFSLETETRTWRDLNKFFRFSIFCDETWPETSGKINQRTSPRPRIIHNPNSSETETRLRVSVPLVSKTRQDRESRQSVLRIMSWMSIESEIYFFSGSIIMKNYSYHMNKNSWSYNRWHWFQNIVSAQLNFNLS